MLNIKDGPGSDGRKRKDAANPRQLLLFISKLSPVEPPESFRQSSSVMKIGWWRVWFLGVTSKFIDLDKKSALKTYLKKSLENCAIISNIDKSLDCKEQLGTVFFLQRVNEFNPHIRTKPYKDLLVLASVTPPCQIRWWAPWEICSSSDCSSWRSRDSWLWRGYCWGSSKPSVQYLGKCPAFILTI